MKFYGMITTQHNNVLGTLVDENLRDILKDLEYQVKKGVSDTLEVCVPISLNTFENLKKNKGTNIFSFGNGVARVTESGVSFEYEGYKTYEEVSCQEMSKELRLSNSSIVLHNLSI